jgi:hypothetical protein
VLLMTKHEFIYIGAAIAAGGVIAFHATRRPATA